MSCPWQAHTMEVSDLLMAQRRWGRTRCRRLLVSLGVPENKRISTLTERQRLALAAVLTAKGDSAGQPNGSTAPRLAGSGALSPA